MASTRRRLAAILGLCLAAWLPSPEIRAQAYPSRPVTLVLPLAAGGGADAITRVLAQFLTQEFKQSFVVENRPGANGNIGNAAVARAAPDGYTLLSAYSGIQVTNPSIYEKPGWDPVTDFKPVALMGRAPHVIVAKKDLPVANVKELVAYAKAHPNKLTFASTGIGALSHIGGEQLMQATGIRMVHVPYRGAGPSMNDLVAGNVDITIVTPASAMGNLAAGNIKALGLMAPTRHPMLPDVSTVDEQDIPGLDLTTWFALFAPAATPDAIVQALAAKVEAVVASPTYRERVRDQGAYADFLGPAALGDLSVWPIIGIHPCVMLRSGRRSRLEARTTLVRPSRRPLCGLLRMTPLGVSGQTLTKKDLAYWRPIVRAAGIKVE